MAYQSPSSLDWLRETVGFAGLAICALLAVSIAGSLMAIFVGAPLGPIPLIGLVAIFFLPFPTLTIYLTVIFLIYLIFLNLPLGKYGAALGVLAGVAAVTAIAFGYPKIANRDFDAHVAKYKQRGSWQPVRLASQSNVTLVRSKDTDIDKGCDGFCFGLLLSGRAKQVTIMTTPAFGRLEDVKISGKRYRLTTAADRCLSRLPQMRSPNLPSPRDKAMAQMRLVQDFKINVLNKAFEEGVKQCIEVMDVENEQPSGWVLVNWQNPFVQGSYDSPKPRLNARVAVMNVRAGRSKIAELFRIDGARVISPAWIWPYGGNAATGGTFEPTLAMGHVGWDGPDLSLDRWWGFVADADEIVSDAIYRVENAKGHN